MSKPTKHSDARYLKIILDCVRVCLGYKPRFGRARGDGLTLVAFQELYRSDPLYSWFGLDNPLMYAAHKAAGGITSVYRQIGIGCERVFRQVLQDAYELSSQDVVWSYEIDIPNGRKRTLHLDGRVQLNSIRNRAAKKRFHDWMMQSAKLVGVDQGVFNSLTGTVFEVRQGYKSKDSKRQNADIANAATAYTKSYLPCAAILSTQIDNEVLHRYRTEKWVVITGSIGRNDATISTYDFMRDIIGYDLAGFFNRNSSKLKSEVDEVLRKLLEPEGG